jgi:diguanylate cyclase (GGDEF)-like protein
MRFATEIGGSAVTNPERDEADADPDREPESSDGLPAGGPADAQTLREGDQTLADTDQTQADTDQTAADKDREASENDEAAAHDDQAASDRDLAHGGDPGVHQASADIRSRSSIQRDQGNTMRSDAAAAREAAATARDLAAAARDRVADMLDRDLEALDAEWSTDGDLEAGSADSARANRDRAVRARAMSAQARARAAADRGEAAADRRRAAMDRQETRVEREAMLHRLVAAELDPLTGAHTRAPGLEELEHEIDRTRRTTGVLTVAYVDVIGLKRVNDTRGHGAGDELLKDVVGVLRSKMRTYDAIVRVGGDEFVCVMSGAGMKGARQRFDSIRASSIDSGCPIKFGIAELRAEDDAGTLVDRADQALPPSPART